MIKLMVGGNILDFETLNTSDIEKTVMKMRSKTPPYTVDGTTSCQVRIDSSDLPNRRGEFAAISGQVGDCYTLFFRDQSYEGLIHKDQLTGFK